MSATEPTLGLVEPSFPRIEDPAQLPPLGDRYELIEPIARGGVAWVWRAHDRVLNRPVAVKMLRADADPSFAARFTNEAQIAARVRHPGVVAVFDAGVHDGLPFLAMELLDGETLRAKIRREGKLDPEEVRRIGRSLASALDAMRRAGLMHGDLKPENVIISDDGSPTITDLGLARAIWETGSDTDDAIWGTPGYLAPERRTGSSGDHRSDVYSLGALLFEAATGTAPPANESPPWASLIEPSVPQELAAVIARATLPDPDERYPTAAAMSMQLASGASAGSDTVSLDPIERDTVLLRPTPVAKARKKRRWRVPVALLALIAVLFGAYWLSPVGKVAVPELTGSTQQDAEAALSEAGLQADLRFVNDSVIAAGVVISQDPAEGARVRKGQTVRLDVSLGPRLVQVPKVEGLGPEAAESELLKAGFATVVRERVFDPVIEIGLVVGTRPARGFQEADQPITMLISKGPEFVEVPKVEGDQESEAVAALRAAGFSVHSIRQEDRDVPSGEVISSDPAAGESVPKGSTVTIVVSKGPPLVQVPDLRCMSKGQAKDALKNANLDAEFEGRGGRVVDQQPGPGERAPEGSTVAVFMGFGVFC
jgi:eukaryotic-like serine/threonine-protein kinase